MKKFHFYEDCIIPIFSIIVSVIFLVMSGKVRPQSAGFPRIMAAILLLCSSVAIIQSIREHAKNAESNKAFPLSAYKTPALTCLGLLTYAFAFIYIGYFVATFFFMMIMMYLLKCRKWGSMLATTIVLELIVYFLFVKWLSVRFPTGLLF